MRRVAINGVKPGDRIGKTVYSADGIVLISAGTQLKDRYIQRLKDFQIPAIVIEDDISEGVIIPELLQEKTRIQAIREVRNSLRSMVMNERIDFKAIRKVVDDIIDEILDNKGVLIGLSDIRSLDEYTYGHCVNVCVMSTILGIALGYDELRLRDLALGALMHDLGKCKVPKEILNKPGGLTEEEFEMIKTHPKEGFELLRKHGEFSSVAAHVAFQHHERIDGQGYPRALQGKEIHEFAKIVAITDVYDALVTDRIYRTALLPHEAVEIIMAEAGKQFDIEIVRIFLNNIALYPNGTIVKLSTGQTGVVIDQNRGANSRPIIRIMDSEEEIDLVKHLSIMISQVIQL